MQRCHRRSSRITECQRDKQERSGLGIEAQKSAAAAYVERTGAETIARYTETESGGNNERQAFARAVAHARRSRATLVIAKLDRLARNLAFLDTLQRSKLNFVALDCEHANKAMLQMMMVMAEWERDQVSARRRKAALAAKRERGEKLRRGETPVSKPDGKGHGARATCWGPKPIGALPTKPTAISCHDMVAWRGARRHAGSHRRSSYILTVKLRGAASPGHGPQSPMSYGAQVTAQHRHIHHRPGMMPGFFMR